MSDSNAGKNVLELLKADHHKVKGLFDEFEKSEDPGTKKRAAAACIEELKLHAAVEEDVFYPAVKDGIEDEEGIVEEAAEEHHVAKMLIAELEEMEGDEENFAAKFTVLAENVRHHIKEEEGVMFPKARRAGLDLEGLGRRVAERKEIFKREGIPELAAAGGGSHSHGSPRGSRRARKGAKKSSD